MICLLLFTFGLCIFILAIKNMYTVAYHPLTIDGSQHILVKKGPTFIIYDTPNGNTPTNTPLIFENATQYRIYVDKLKKQGIRCPELFIQETIDTQGNTTYTIKIDPFNPKNVDYKYTCIEGLTSQESNKNHTSPYDRKIYMDNLASNIANSLSVNQIKSINKLELTKSVLELDPPPKCTETPDDILPLVKDGKTADPMTNNWGGIVFSQKLIDEGLYKGNEVTKPDIVKTNVNISAMNTKTYKLSKPSGRTLVASI